MGKGEKSFTETEYDLNRAKVLGNMRWILERYPNDTLLHDHLGYLTNGMCKLTQIIMTDKKQLKRFKKEVLQHG